MTMRRVLFCVLLIGCNKGGGDGDSDSSTGGTDSFTSGHSHTGTDPSAVSLTFTNTGDPTDDPSDPTDPTTDPSTDPSTSGVADSSSGSGETTGVAESSSGGGSESGTTGAVGMCCEAQNGPGCGDMAIEMCVCASDSTCCDVQWDAFCTVQVVLLDCDTCPNIGGDGDCCAAHDNPGCDDDMIEACVCEQDFVCCTEAWDDVCVGEVANGCGSC
jgi:hypothetical protein